MIELNMAQYAYDLYAFRLSTVLREDLRAGKITKVEYEQRVPVLWERLPEGQRSVFAYVARGLLTVAADVAERALREARVEV